MHRAVHLHDICYRYRFIPYLNNMFAKPGRRTRLNDISATTKRASYQATLAQRRHLPPTQPSQRKTADTTGLWSP